MKGRHYTAAVIGCGAIGVGEEKYARAIRPATHAAAWGAHPRVRLVALVDPNVDCLRRGARLNPAATCFKSAKKLFQTFVPDIVSVATPPEKHREMVELATRAGVRAILCENPIAATLADASAMIAACRKSGTLLIVNHQRRFDELLQRSARFVRGGGIGHVRQAVGFYYNGVFTNGTHIVDLMRMFLGEPVEVSGRYNKETSWNPADKNIDGTLRFQNGTHAALLSLDRNYGLFSLDIIGESGAVKISHLGFSVARAKKVKNGHFRGFYELGPFRTKGRPRSFMSGSMAAVVRMLDKKVKPFATGDDARATLRVLLALQTSAEGKKPFFLSNKDA